MRAESTLDGPKGARAGCALGAGCAWLWSCGGAGRLRVRRSLWRRQHSDDYRGGTALTVRPEAPTPGSAIRALPDLCFGIGSERLVMSDILLTLSPSPGTSGAFFCSQFSVCHSRRQLFANAAIAASPRSRESACLPAVIYSVPISQFFEPSPGVIRNPVLRIGLSRKSRYFYFRPIGKPDDDQPSRSHLYGAWFKSNFGDGFGQWCAPIGKQIGAPEVPHGISGTKSP